MSFSSNVKDELIRLPLGKPCCMLSELSALTRTSGSLSMHGLGRILVSFRVENAALARRIFLLLRTQLQVTPKLYFVQHARLGGRRTCVLTLGDQDSQKLLLALHMVEKDEEGHVSFKRTSPRHPMTRQCCRRAFLRAAFLGAGTMTTPEKAYHLEWRADNESLLKELQRLLDKAGLPVHTSVRRGSPVVYFKGAQQVTDALALMGASGSVLEMENIRISKQMRGSANRAINCDEHNSDRMVNAAAEQVEAIKQISIHQGLSSLPPALYAAARLRLDNPELSLTELGQMLDPPVGKSGMNHRMRRLMELARTMEEEESETD